MDEQDVTKSIVILSNQIDNSLQLTNKDLIQSISLKIQLNSLFNL
jgi:hypothetical protein